MKFSLRNIAPFIFFIPQLCLAIEANPWSPAPDESQYAIKGQCYKFTQEHPYAGTAQFCIQCTNLKKTFENFKGRLPPPGERTLAEQSYLNGIWQDYNQMNIDGGICAMAFGEIPESELWE